MEKMINSLKKLGLSRYESQAYIGLVKIVSGTADEIAEISELPRSRIYDILNNLEKKGFVEIERGRPLKYTVVPPYEIFKAEKEKLFDNLNEIENKLTDIYNDEISEVPAPVWLVHTQDNIIEKEIEIIRKSQKLITIRAGFILKGEAQEMIKAFNNIPRSVKIKIIANKECYVDNEKLEIIDLFKKSKLSNLEIIKFDLPMIKMIIVDEKELFGTFAEIDCENSSINSKTLIGVHNKYESLCKNFNDHFLKQFNQITKM